MNTESVISLDAEVLCRQWNLSGGFIFNRLLRCLLTGSQNMAVLKAVMLQRETAFLHRKLPPQLKHTLSPLSPVDMKRLHNMAALNKEF